MTIEKILETLDGMAVTDDFENDIICAFGDYEYDGETYVVVNKDESNDNIDYQAYISHADSPIICIKIDEDKIIDVWIA